MRPVRDHFLVAVPWILAGSIAFAGGIAVQLPPPPGDCAGCVETLPYTAGGRGR